MRFQEQVNETATALNVSERDAMVMELIAAAAWAHIGRKQLAEAVMWVGAKHAAGQMDGATMRQCFRAMGL